MIRLLSNPSHDNFSRRKQKMTTVTDIAGLNAAIVAADGATTPGTVTITLGGNISLGTTALEAINLHSGVTLDIEGSGFTLDGGGTQGGLFVYAGTVDINNLAINDMLEQGGAGTNGRQWRSRFGWWAVRRRQRAGRCGQRDAHQCDLCR